VNVIESDAAYTQLPYAVESTQKTHTRRLSRKAWRRCNRVTNRYRMPLLQKGTAAQLERTQRLEIMPHLCCAATPAVEAPHLLTPLMQISNRASTRWSRRKPIPGVARRTRIPLSGELVAEGFL
jgi:hypothetical protein